ncbi:MAG: FkbM family methyltransferase [Pseudomonadota bacterium]
MALHELDPLVAEVEGKHGRFRYLRHDIFIGASMRSYGEYSEFELEFLLNLVAPEATVVEAGANIGSHTIPLAGKIGPGGRIIAFEPQPLLFQILNDNLELNDVSNVETRASAVGAVQSKGFIDLPDYSVPGNFGGVEVSSQGVTVPIVSIDDELGETPVHLIKLDIEGMEGAALAGASRVISRYKPLLYLENNHRDLSANLIRQVFDLGYCAFWHLPLMFNPDNYFNEERDFFPGIISTNMLCVPNHWKIDRSGSIQDPEDHPFN